MPPLSPGVGRVNDWLGGAVAGGGVAAGFMGSCAIQAATTAPAVVISATITAEIKPIFATVGPSPLSLLWCLRGGREIPLELGFPVRMTTSLACAHGVSRSISAKVAAVRPPHPAESSTVVGSERVVETGAGGVVNLHGGDVARSGVVFCGAAGRAVGSLGVPNRVLPRNDAGALQQQLADRRRRYRRSATPR